MAVEMSALEMSALLDAKEREIIRLRRGANNVAGADSPANDHWSVSPAASAAVPEPATPLILLSGLVLLGCTLRTRKRS